jgi:hypothetical protein
VVLLRQHPEDLDRVVQVRLGWLSAHGPRYRAVPTSGPPRGAAGPHRLLAPGLAGPVDGLPHSGEWSFVIRANAYPVLLRGWVAVLSWWRVQPSPAGSSGWVAAVKISAARR